MNKKDFVVKKIRELKRIRPDSSWLSSQKSFILSEISRTEEKKRKPSLVLPLFNFNILKIFKPAFALALAIIILITSLVTIGAIGLAQNSLPGDLLYPLKTAFEQTQLTFTSSQENKAKLSIKFATHRMDEFTQLIDKPEKKKDMEKTVKKFTEQLVSVRENIDKLKEKNTEKAAEVAKLVKSQTPFYEETLIESNEKLANIIPGDKEDLEKDIDEALIEVSKIGEMSEGLIPEPVQSPEGPEVQPSADGAGIEAGKEETEEALVPGEEETIESPSMPFEDLQEEIVPQEEESQEEQ